jgi:hypothetical protein
MSISAGDRERLWANTMGFLPSEINDLSEGAAIANTASGRVGNFTNPVTNPYASAAAASENVRLIDVASLINVDPVQMVKDLCEGKPDKETCRGTYLDANGQVLADARIPAAVATSYADAISKKRGTKSADASALLQQIRQLGFLPAQQGITIPTPTPAIYSDLKIAVSGGTVGKNEFALSDLFKEKAVDPDNCLFDENIAGRVTYMALLTRNTAFCNEGNKFCREGKFVNPANGGQEYDIPENQYFTSRETALWLSLNGGSHFVVPSFFEDWLAHVKKLNNIDLIIGVVIGSIAFKQKVGAQIRDLKDDLRAGKQTGAVNQFVSAQDNAQTHFNSYQAHLGTLPAARQTELTDIEKRYARLSASTNAREQYQAQEMLRQIQTGNVGGVALSSQERMYLENMLSSRQAVQVSQAELQTQAAKMANLADLEEKKKIYDALSRGASNRLWTSMVIGIGWLGPARLAFSAANRMLFSFGGRNQPQHLILFAGGGTIGKFKDATDIYGFGRVMDIVSQNMGGVVPPEKAFKPGSLFFINKPADDLKESNSLTMISSRNGSLTINTQWEDRSFVTAFEDVRGFDDKDKFTSLQLSAYQVFPPSVSLDRKEAANTLSYLSSLAVPWIIASPMMREPGSQILGLGTALLFNQIVMKTDPNEFKDVECDAATLKHYKQLYTASLAVGWTTSYLVPFLRLFQQAQIAKATAVLTKTWFGAASGISAETIFSKINTLNLATAWQWWLITRAQNYVTACKDPQHLIFAYQEMKPVTKKKATQMDDKLKSLTDALSNLKLGQEAAKAAGANATTPLDQMKEILSVKLAMENQFGNVQPEDVFYLQIERSAFSVKSRLWDMLHGEGCRFQENYQSGDKTARFTVDGINFYDQSGRLLTAFNDYAWRLRSLGRLRSQEMARVILPNKLIQATLECGAAPFLEVKAGGDSTLVGSCSTANCLKQRIFEVTGRQVQGGDLSPFLGRVSSVDTSEGIAAVETNAVRFTRLVSKKIAKGEEGSGKKGSEVSAPSIEDYTALAGRLEGSKLIIDGDGTVQVDGPPGSTVSNRSLGELRTIIGDRGKIEFDPATRNLVLFIYVLADELAANVNKIDASVTKNKLSDGTEVPAVKMDTGEKTGLDNTFRNALSSIQGTGGMQSWEDANHLYYLTKDANGNDILRVIDKNTGQATDYKITGPITRNADGSITIPTDKGPFTFSFGKDAATGAPTLSATGPDGLKELAELLAARGQNGIMTFNPSTGAISIYNGQDIPLSPEFAKKGISFTGDAQGNTIGTPQANLFGPTRGGTAGSTEEKAQQPFTLPSWPNDQPLLAALMLAAVLGLVLVIRRRTAPTTF